MRSSRSSSLSSTSKALLSRFWSPCNETGASLPGLGVCRADVTDMGSDASSAVFGDASAVLLRPGDEYIRSSSSQLGLRRRFGHRKKTHR